MNFFNTGKKGKRLGMGRDLKHKNKKVGGGWWQNVGYLGGLKKYEIKVVVQGNDKEIEKINFKQRVSGTNFSKRWFKEREKITKSRNMVQRHDDWYVGNCFNILNFLLF